MLRTALAVVGNGRNETSTHAPVYSAIAFGSGCLSVGCHPYDLLRALHALWLSALLFVRLWKAPIFRTRAAAAGSGGIFPRRVAVALLPRY